MNNSSWKTLLSAERLFDEQLDHNAHDNRSFFDMDHDRVVYSNYFRRLHDKTQVFPYAPLSSSNQARSRLSHSLEVSCVGRSLGNLAGQHLRDSGIDVVPYDLGSIVATACLAHDIGNPPFGHFGEDAIRSWARSRLANARLNSHERADLENFEGNAQGFRILTRLEAWQRRGGLRPTLATLGAFVKYPCPSTYAGSRPQSVMHKKFGYFLEDRATFEAVFSRFPSICHTPGISSRHPLAFLAEAADDICYAIIDLEDAWHLGYVRFEDVRCLLAPIAGTDPWFNDIADYEDDLRLARMRSACINALIRQVIDVWKDNAAAMLECRFDSPLLEQCPLAAPYRDIVDFSFEHIYSAHRVLEIERAGFTAINGLLDLFGPALLSGATSSEDFITALLLPIMYLKRYDLQPAPDLGKKDQYRYLLDNLSDYAKVLSVTDYLTGMTDRFAIELYQRLSGMKLPVF